MDLSPNWNQEAMDEITATSCDFTNALVAEAANIAAAAGRSVVTREDVEKARIKVWPA